MPRGTAAIEVSRGQGSGTVVAGDLNAVKITARDAFGNRRAVGGDDAFRWSLAASAAAPNVIGRDDTYTGDAPTSRAPTAIPAAAIVSKCDARHRDTMRPAVSLCQWSAP